MKKVKLAIVSVCVLLLTGCMDNELGEENMRRANINHNFLNYKQNIYSEWGKECAFYKGRIYFFQDENIPGIYSIDARGNGKRIEVEVQSIRKLQVLEDGIYFTGPVSGDELNRYTIYKKCWNKDNVEDYLINFSIKESNVWDFFIDMNHTMVIISLSKNIPIMNLCFNTFIVDSEKNVILLSDYVDYLVDYKQENVEDRWTNLFGYEDFLFVARTGIYDNSEDFGLFDTGEQNLSIYHIGRDEILLFRNQAIFNERGCNSIVQTIHKDEFILANRNKFLWIKENASQYSKLLEIPDIKEIKYSIKKEGDLLTIVSDGTNEYIYTINLDFAQIVSKFQIPNKENVLAVDQQRLYTVSKEEVHIYEMNSDKCKLKSRIKWKNRLKDTSKLLKLPTSKMGFAH